ncbi:MAG: ABC transporter ATP-binding protein [Verrucomicrobia bacterium]|nr:ABC transporter ATP-binding protein [Verrucomicrobiota bacterium]MBU6446638.1 ABC transporter ATP-binding protein [Verrucomicrobiota bacterium]MDE3047532.1 ABC transporter ATP-binding protein [Verrucomicrobiota bacterium]
MYYLSVKDLTKVYGKKKPFIAVDHISFDLKPGEILGFLGPNGSGKTTTIQMLLGTLSATSGSIVYFGKDFFKHRSEALQSVSFASTYTSLPYILTVQENLRCFGLFYGIQDFAKRTDPLLERFGILDKKHDHISSLSAGQITRLMIVKAFFTNPKIVLLDEPTASLDPDVSQEVCRFLLEERDRTGLSILFTSHKMEEVAELCDRTIVLKNGHIIADDLPENLAHSVSLYQLRLTIIDGMKRAVALADKFKVAYQLEHRVISFSLDEKEIPKFLNQLMQSGVSYASIQVQEPSLEDYFLKIAEKSV